jgi:hypothetical protein
MPATLHFKTNTGPYRSPFIEKPIGIVTDKKLRVFVANISLDDLEEKGEDALRDELAEFGPLDRWTLFINRAGRYTGAGICTFRTGEAASECIKVMNRRHNADGTMLRVEQCREDGVELASTLQARDRELATLDHGGKWTRGRLPPASTWRGGRGGNSNGRGRGAGRSTMDDLDAEMDKYIAEQKAKDQAQDGDEGEIDPRLE